MNQVPSFYENMTGYPEVKRLASNANTLSTTTKILKTTTIQIEIESTDFDYTYRHNLEGIHEVLGKFKERNVKAEHMIPYFEVVTSGKEVVIENITENEIVVNFKNFTAGDIVDLELYFLEFGI